MDDGSESRFWPFLGKLFNVRNGASVESHILDAKREGELKADDVAMLLNVLRLGGRLVREIMIPRTDIVCAEEKDPLPEVIGAIIESGHSRIPIYRENRDHITGIIHAKDLLRAMSLTQNGACVDDAINLQELARKPFFIPETKNVKELMQEFRANKIHLAIALDEYGGTSGLITFEDVLEEIVGEIEDEYDAPRPDEIQPLEDGGFLLAGRTTLADVTRFTGVVVVSDQVETIGGYLSELAGRVPQVGEIFTVGGHEFTVQEADHKQVRWLSLKLLEHSETDDARAPES